MTARVLLVEDDPARADLLARTLGADFECAVAATADAALGRLAEGWDAAVVDFDLGSDGTGFMVLQAVHLMSERTARVLYTSHWNDGLAQEARRTARAHASLDARREDFLLQLRRTLSELVAHEEAEPAPAAAGRAADADRWCASASATHSLLDDLHAAAGEGAAVFVHGEPGAGKHLAAETLQRWRGAGAGANEGESRPARLIRVPPLRERREDVAALAAGFLGELASRTGRPARALTDEALTELSRRTWWGNVRELHAVLYRAALLSPRALVGAADLPRDIVPPPPALQGAKDDGLLQAMLLQLRTAGTVNAAAKLAGVTRPNFKRLMKRHGVLRADTYEPLD